MIEKGALSAAIVGGGITGLATAYYLEQAAAAEGWDITGVVLERDSRMGGKLLTTTLDGFLVEGGPDSILTQKPWALRLLDELGMGGEVIQQQANGVFLLHGGKLHRIPRGLVGPVPTKPLDLLGASFLTWRGKLRAGLEPLVPRRRDGEEESLGGFLRRRLGTDVAQNLVETFTAGVYAGDPLELGTRQLFPTLVDWEERHGSLAKGIRAARAHATVGSPPRPFVSLRRGMSSLPQAIAEGLRSFKLLPGKRVTNIARGRGNERPLYELTVDGGEPIIADCVALTIPAPGAASVLRTILPEAADLLDQMSFASTCSVSLAFRREAVGNPLDGSGFLVPRTEPSPVTGCTWSSAKWPGRAGEGWVLLRAFVGWAGDASFMQRDDPDLVRSVTEALRPLLDLRGEPERTWVQRWPEGMPQYKVGHGPWVESVDRAMSAEPGLFLAGASYRGIGVPDCVRQGQETAQRMASLVSQPAEARA
jgi:oxygen-dependent protoporphyrinogen oxidase